jgi:hypothetical protein
LRHKRSIGEYLAFLSVRYQVDPEKFLDALRQAKEHKKANCDNLSIEFRGSTHERQIFLIRNESGVVAQFRVEDFLLETGNSLRIFMDTDMIRRHLFKKRMTANSRFIKDLRAGMTNVNLKAKVLEVAEPKRVVTRQGNYADVAKALIADETGTISLCLWNEQIHSISVGDTVQICNAKTSMFKGERQPTLSTREVLSTVRGIESPIPQPA